METSHAYILCKKSTVKSLFKQFLFFPLTFLSAFFFFSAWEFGPFAYLVGALCQPSDQDFFYRSTAEKNSSVHDETSETETHKSLQNNIYNPKNLISSKIRAY